MLIQLDLKGFYSIQKRVELWRHALSFSVSVDIDFCLAWH